MAGVAAVAPSTQEPLLAAPPDYGLVDLLAALWESAPDRDRAALGPGETRETVVAWLEAAELAPPRSAAA